MILVWDEGSLGTLVEQLGLKLYPVQPEVELPIFAKLYGDLGEPFLNCLMQTDRWAALGYSETDRVSLVQYLGSLGCRTDGVSVLAARYQHPLTLELAKALIDAEILDVRTLFAAARWQNPLTSELAKLLIDAGCDPAAQDDIGWDALVCLADGGHPVDPQVTDLFLSAGCRTDLDGDGGFFLDEHSARLDRILKEHAQWQESLSRMSAENSAANLAVDWDR